jgi:hypothetical protein
MTQHILNFRNDRLANLCESLRQGREAIAQSANDQHQRMRELVDKYGEFAQAKTNGRSNEGARSEGKTIVRFYAF